jgi:hypothetical protein
MNSKSQETTMYEDLNVELLPARTVMTCVSGSPHHRRTTNTTTTTTTNTGGAGGAGGTGGAGGSNTNVINVPILSGNNVSLLTSGNHQTSGPSGVVAGAGGAGGNGGAGGSAG